MKHKIIMMSLLVLTLLGAKAVFAQTVNFQKTTETSGSGLAWIVNVPAFTPPSGTTIPAHRLVVCSGPSRSENRFVNYRDSDGRAGVSSSIYVVQAGAPTLRTISCPANFYPLHDVTYARVDGSRYACEQTGYIFISSNSAVPTDIGFVLGDNSSSIFSFGYITSGAQFTGFSYSGGNADFETEVLCYQ